jgi:hypothetical protein
MDDMTLNFLGFLTQSICDSDKSGAGEFTLDDFTGIGKALAAFHPGPEPRIGAMCAGLAGGACGFPHLTFPKRIADTDDHVRSHRLGMDDSMLLRFSIGILRLMQVVLSYCRLFQRG